jgi:hypothetical protein
LRPIVEAFPHVANLLTAGQLLMVNRGGVVAIPPQFHLYTGPCCYLLAMSFDWRGNAILCMNDLRTENPITFGNIHDTGLLELWANPRYIALRRSIRRNSGLPPICAKCLVNFTP